MKNFTLSTAFAFGISCFAVPAVVSAQEALSSCNPLTGLTPSGAECVTLTPVDPTRYQTQIDGEGASNFRPVNVGELAETYECNRSGPGTGYGADVAILIEDCGEALALDPATFKEFVGYSGNAAPAPTPVYTAPPVTAPAPAYVAPPPVTVPAPVVSAPPVYAAPMPSPVGLGNAGLFAAGLGAAALVGIGVLAFGDDDDNATATTTN